MHTASSRWLSQPPNPADCASACLEEDLVLAFLEGRLAPDEIAQVDCHVTSCESCSALVVAAAQVCRDAHVPSPSPDPRCWGFEPRSRVGGRFIIRRLLGRGGMGDVYEAFDLELEETVAIKMARAALSYDPDLSRRMKNEVRLARRIQHPTIRRVHDLGVHCDVRPPDARLCFISMEHIDGESLAQQIGRRPLSLEQLSRLGRELLGGVAAIHRAGIVHRDVKSHNIMLRNDTAEGGLVIIDFGLAVAADQPAPATPTPAASPFCFEGSPAYMAPEQFRSAPAKPTIDVFSCGVVLFQSLTGRLPFRSLAPERRSGARRDPLEPPLRASNVLADIPQQIDAFIARCLDLDPSRRFVDAHAARAAFDVAFAAA